MPDAPELYRYTLGFILIFGVINWVTLWFISAPYGRHARAGWGPTLGARAAWVAMELPAPVAFAAVFCMFASSCELVPLTLAAMFLTHYIYRTFVYPFRMRGGARKPLLTVGFGALFNMVNGAINAYALLELAPHLQRSWLYDPRFLVGAALFAFGYTVNHQSDAILRRLRRPGDTGYKIPYGGLYRWLSCPNYFGELVEWIGFALAAWTPAAAAFAFFTASNLIPRAVSHHRWYHKQFTGYPRERRAVVPFLL
jgi:hypothetical protein